MQINTTVFLSQALVIVSLEATCNQFNFVGDALLKKVQHAECLRNVLYLHPIKIKLT
jgi:hypothetical protein